MTIEQLEGKRDRAEAMLYRTMRNFIDSDGSIVWQGNVEAAMTDYRTALREANEAKMQLATTGHYNG